MFLPPKVILVDTRNIPFKVWSKAIWAPLWRYLVKEWLWPPHKGSFKKFPQFRTAQLHVVFQKSYLKSFNDLQREISSTLAQKPTIFSVRSSPFFSFNCLFICIKMPSRVAPHLRGLADPIDLRYVSVMCRTGSCHWGISGRLVVYYTSFFIGVFHMAEMVHYFWKIGDRNGILTSSE